MNNSRIKCKFRIGDTVKVISGSDKGKSGVITKVLLKDTKVIIEGINKKVKHIKKTDHAPGEKKDIFSPINWSNVAFYKDGKTHKIAIKRDSGKKQRYSRIDGRGLDE